LEAERSAPISCHFLFDSWRQSENQKEIIVVTKDRETQTTYKTIFLFILTLEGGNAYLILILKIKMIVVFLRQSKL
jgi:hypothetical protein